MNFDRNTISIKRQEVLPLTILFLLGLFLRLYHMPIDPYGDEAVYYYQAKYLKFVDPHIFPIPPYRLIHALIFHPFTTSIWTFRYANIIIGASLPLVVYLLAKWLSDNWLYSYGASLIITFSSIHIQFSQFNFPPTLATFFVVVGLMWYYENRPILAFIFFFLAVFSWEATIIVPISILLITVLNPIFHDTPSLSSTLKNPNVFLNLLLIILTGAAAFDNVLLHQQLPGWAKAPLDMHTIIYITGGVFPLVFLVYGLMLQRDMSSLVLSTSPLLFFIGYNLIFGTQIQIWYMLFPLTFLYLYLPKALTKVEHPTALLALILVISFYVLNPLPYYGNAGLHEGFVMDTVQYISDNYNHPKIVLVDVFWGYQYWPFGEIGSITYVKKLNSTWTTLTSCNSKYLFVIPTSKLREFRALKTHCKLKVVYQNPALTVLSVS